MGDPFLRLTNFSYGYPGAADLVLRDISLAIEPGSCILLEGPTGCGKSTLLLALRGLLPPGASQGQLATQASVGLVLQRPATQLLYATVGADVAFGLENRCIAPEKMKNTVEGSLALLGVDRPLGFPVDRLSMGQQYRSCIAGQMVCEPDVILLDEPIAQLDPLGRKQILKLIEEWKTQGKAILISEHLGPVVHSVVDHVWQMDMQGRLTVVSLDKETIRDEQVYLPGKVRKQACRNSESAETAVVFSLQKVQLFASPSSQMIFDFDLYQGQGMAIIGENGCGKTTLMRCLAGLDQPEHGLILFQGAAPTLSTVQGRLAYLLQDPKKQLFETTVFAEVAFGGKRCGLSGDQLKKRVHILLKHLGIEHLQATSPHLLSYGQKHLVGLAAVLAGAPKVLLLDDPFAGLDTTSIRRVLNLIHRECKEQKLTVIWTSHDPVTTTDWADRVCVLGEVEGFLERSEETADKKRGSRWAWYGAEEKQASISSGKLLACCTLLSCLAFTAKGPFALGLLSAINGLLIALVAPSPLRLLHKSIGFFLWQSGLVVLLYMFRFGVLKGIEPGLLMAWQLFLGFWPGIIFMKISNARETSRVIGRFLSPRLAFVFSVCLRFLPMLIAEMREIREIQILRGARLFLRDLRHPRSWPDWLHCLLVPTLIRTLALADEIALAARNRDFGRFPHRTYWPGE